MINKNKHQLYDIENTIIVELLNYLEDSNYHFFKKTPPLIKDYILKSNMKKYKIQNLDVEILQEILISLDNQVVENIFLQCYLLTLKWNKQSSSSDRKINKAFSSLGEFRIETLIDLAQEYNNGKITKEQLFHQNDSKILKTSVKLRAIRLFEMYKSTSFEKIDNIKLNKLNKGALKKVWDKVIKNLEIINNPTTPKHIKAIAIGAIIYVIAPIDAIPDIIPIGGLVDDAAIVLMALEQINVLFKKRNL